MRKRILQLFLTTLLLALGSSLAIAQTVVTGKVIDSETSEPLIGVSVSTGQRASLRGVTTDMDGGFRFEVPAKSVLTFRCVGYATVTRSIGRGSQEDLGTILLDPQAIGLDEIQVIASVVPKDRMTPVPVSNIRVADIQAASLNVEFPELVKSTPSTYTTKGSGGFGDGRTNVRGFDTYNFGVLINGVPVNGMEDGKVYWSNWSGLMNQASTIQIQRGLGASKLGISSVGGTMNIITKTTDANTGGSAYVGMGNDGLHKESFSISTGMNDGWAITIAGSHMTGLGYVKGLKGRAFSYFFNVSKKFNERHTLSLTGFGAPQWHNQRSSKYSVADYDKYGIRHNQSFGYLRGELTPTAYAYNTYHKPQFSLNHFWKMDENTSLYTAAYASLATGGGRRAYGKNSKWVLINYNTGQPYEQTKVTPDGLIDYDAVLAANAAASNGSEAIFALGSNSHKWFGLLSSFKKKLNSSLTLTAGYDGRYYRGDHYDKITDLLGGSYYIEDPKTKLAYHTEGQQLKVGDIVNRDYTGEIMWQGLFAQMEHSSEWIDAFVSGSINYELYRNHNYGGSKSTGYLPGVSPWKSFLPWSGKAGLSYKFAQGHNVFANGGFFTRAPLFGNVYAAGAIIPNDKANMEKVLTGEVGYGFTNHKNFEFNINGYYTKWMDRVTSKRIGNEYVYLNGVDAVHCGVEAEISYRPIRQIDLRGMFSLGDWTWQNNVSYTSYDEAGNETGQDITYIKGLHVGDAAQMTAAVSADIELFKGFHVIGKYNFLGKNYAGFNPATRNAQQYEADGKEIVESWKLPDVGLFDLSASYNFKLGSLSTTFYFNMDNVADKRYVSDADDNIIGKKHDEASALVWYGFGRTWSTGIRVNF